MATSPKPLTRPVTITMPMETSDCCAAAGTPMRSVCRVTGPRWLKRGQEGAMGAFFQRSQAIRAPSATTWEIKVAQAVPFSPSFGSPSHPKMRMGSRAVVKSTEPNWK